MWLGSDANVRHGSGFPWVCTAHGLRSGILLDGPSQRDELLLVWKAELRLGTRTRPMGWLSPGGLSSPGNPGSLWVPQASELQHRQRGLWLSCACVGQLSGRGKLQVDNN